MKLGIRARLMALALSFLVIPALGYLSAVEMKAFLLRGQRNAQLIAAQAIASVLRGRHDLFYFHQDTAASPAMEKVFYIYQSTGPIRLDGDPSEWAAIIAAGARRFGRESVIMESAGGFDPKYGGFTLAMALWEGRVYLLADIRDERPVPPSKGLHEPMKADHLALSLSLPEGGWREYVIPVSPTGELGFWARETPEAALEPDGALSGNMKTSETGYTMEISIPESMIAGQMAMKLTLADVDEAASRRIKTVVGPREEGADGLIRLAYPKSLEIQALLENLDFGDATVTVVDKAGRVRAATAGRGDGGGLAGRYIREDELTRRVLTEGAAISVNMPGGPAGETALAGAPIKSPGGQILGAVILERSAGQALSMQAKAVENALWSGMLAFVVVSAGLVIYSSRLALRIHRLRREAEGAIDPAGRVRTETLSASRDSGDEIGDLSRSISGLLIRLKRHHDFLTLLPRTLQHEMNNPLSAIGASLENLSAQTPAGHGGEKYIQSARRGAARLKEMVNALVEAASVEEAVRKEKPERLDISRLLELYMENSARINKTRSISQENSAGRAYVMASDYRIEQILDKLMDNAMDFCPEGGRIMARLRRDGAWLELVFGNDGPAIPDPMLGSVFDSLVSGREGGAGARPHLGIGLYIVRVVAEAHG